MNNILKINNIMTNREKSLSWWANLSLKNIIEIKPRDRIIESLTGKEIEELYTRSEQLTKDKNIERFEDWIIKTPMVLETAYGVIDHEDNVDLSISLGIKKGSSGAWFGWFELDGGKDWYAEGNIDIEDDRVIGYDGVFELSIHIINKLKEWGYNCEEIE